MVGALAIARVRDDVEHEVRRGALAHIRALGAALDDTLQSARRTVELAGATWADAPDDTRATQLLLRHTWPGNAAQLWQVLKQVVQRRRVGQIMPEDLPPECWTVSRRVLSPLESIERDAIVQSLLDHGGNKIRAARALGMSRATVYRRIHEYGIVTPPTV